MGFGKVHLPGHIKESIDGEVTAGRVASETEFLVEAARRYAEDLEGEDEIVTEALAGIADSEAGRHVTIATPADAETHHKQTMTRLLCADDALFWMGHRPSLPDSCR